MSILGNIVGKLSPVLGQALNAFIPGSGLIVSGLSALFGASSESDLINRINADPMAAEKLKEFELQHETDLQALIVQDRDSARKREMSVVASTGRTDKTVSILAFIFVGGFFAYSFCLFFVHIDSTAHDIVLFLAGQIASMALMVGGYYFGSMLKAHLGHTVHDIQLPPPAETRKG